MKPPIDFIDFDKIQIGETYAIYGAITEIVAEEEECCLIQINNNIDAMVILDVPEKINFLKERAFEPAVFISKIVAKGDRISVDCHKVVFDPREPFNIQ